MEEGFWKDLALLGLIGLNVGQAGSRLAGHDSLAKMLFTNPPAKIVQSITKDAAKNDMQGIEDDAQVLQGYLKRWGDDLAQGEDPELSTRLNDKEKQALSNIQQSLESSSNPEAQKVLDTLQAQRAGNVEFAARATGKTFGGQFK